MISARLRIAEAVLVTAAIVVGISVRARYLDTTPFWVDEAESSINALTILEYGYPADRYLGNPLFENTLIKPWPGNPEYEFKDISYSDRGMVTYHGWLPLYSIAASFAANGVEPDKIGAGAPARRDLAELKRRTRAARIPSLLFGALFLACCYIAGTSLYGRDAGAAALLTATVSTFHADASIQARYYSALITLSTCTVLMIWLIVTKGSWRHYAGGAAVFLLLFLTHLVTFAAAVFVLTLLTPIMFLRHERFWMKLTVFGAVVLGGVTWWVGATGFLSGLGIIPAARRYLSLPSDFVVYPIGRGVHIGLFVVLLALIIAARRPGTRMPDRWAKPLRESAAAVMLLALWIVASYGAFFFFIPAVSFDVSRMKYPYWGPALLVGSIFCAVVARIVARRFSIYVAPALACLLAMATGVALFSRPGRFGDWNGIVSVRNYIERSKLTDRTKLYALPNSHLILSFYTGRPFQTIYPVRKTFLDAYPDDILYVDFDEFGVESRNADFAPERLRIAAARAGEPLDEAGAEMLSERMRTFEYRQAMQRRIGGVAPTSAESLPAYAERLMAAERASAFDRFQEMAERTPILRGYRIANWRDWIGVFEYRFVDPKSRMGPALNYADRLRGSEADLLSDAGWVIYRSRPDRNRNNAVSFHLVR